MKDISSTLKNFSELIESEVKRIERMKEAEEFTNFKELEKIIIGIAPGDGIGPIIIEQARRVLNLLLEEEIKAGKVELREIEGLTIENRAAKLQSVPEEVLAEIKKCHVLLKGPTTTPRATDPWPNLPSANATLRRELDLFANVRPMSMPEKGIDWTFYRENIEGAYIWGSKGIQVDENLAIDFVVETAIGSERIARAAFEFAKNNGKTNVTVVTKANIVKLTDGNLIKACKKVAEEYPEITLEERFVDVTAAKLSDMEFSKDLQVFVLPNLYGDIITDIAAELQGGLGTAGAANIGAKYAIFEAIHGSAPFLINNNRGEYADPSSVLRGTAMLLSHIGYQAQSEKLTRTLDICGIEERKIVITSQRENASTAEYGDYVIETIKKL
ncbi:isocitrate/isopropylmalate family dehydrogenase [Clostridium magnum]|uniref:Homoisocitrate dehydrogenase n=1 Tax=Clostridium magnum DSM 2767 TaxID=1121326 RepID=A0A162RW54_9CLOT|nr:isocitrate/isopropylmalate family dehydrogenase [Clostridium magnum]KZL90453.1 homoisocitrate dehydrogenase [Clostridium magnum DSM 2767]SHH85546.1 isocitrate dehydrogenase (NAD+) [Clostridium magnum DSM 2767]